MITSLRMCASNASISRASRRLKALLGGTKQNWEEFSSSSYQFSNSVSSISNIAL
jgi:hypothetical protein